MMSLSRANMASKSPRLSRRRLLAVGSSAGIIGFGGCLGSITTSEQEVCSSGYREIGGVFTERSIVNSLRYASLTVPQSIRPGEKFVATLTNESTDSLTTLGKRRYMIQRLSPDGMWRNTIGVPEKVRVVAVATSAGARRGTQLGNDARCQRIFRTVSTVYNTHTSHVPVHLLGVLRT